MRFTSATLLTVLIYASVLSMLLLGGTYAPYCPPESLVQVGPQLNCRSLLWNTAISLLAWSVIAALCTLATKWLRLGPLWVGPLALPASLYLGTFMYLATLENIRGGSIGPDDVKAERFTELWLCDAVVALSLLAALGGWAYGA